MPRTLTELMVAALGEMRLVTGMEWMFKYRAEIMAEWCAKRVTTPLQFDDMLNIVHQDPWLLQERVLVDGGCITSADALRAVIHAYLVKTLMPAAEICKRNGVVPSSNADD